MIKILKNSLTFPFDCAYIEIACEVKVMLFVYSDHNRRLDSGGEVPAKSITSHTHPGVGTAFFVSSMVDFKRS